MTKQAAHSHVKYVAGVIDASACIRIRMMDTPVHGRVPCGAEINVTCEPRVADRLIEVLGGRWAGGIWRCPAAQQKHMCETMLPHVVRGQVYDKLTRVLRLREVVGKRRLSRGAVRYRMGLVNE